MRRDNEYMNKLADRYNRRFKRRDELEEKLRKAKEEFGYDSEEYEAAGTEYWDYKLMMDEAYKTARGEIQAVNMYCYPDERFPDEVILSSHIWDSDVKCFVDTLRDAKVKKFIYTNQSTAVMDNIHDLVNNRCRMVGVWKRKYVDEKFGEKTIEELRGIEFEVL